uniref:uncharacterized protein isoform X3 n=1 Tax=Myxine glutinosa TaxID=7769 RepID=UPI00358EBF52
MSKAVVEEVKNMEGGWETVGVGERVVATPANPNRLPHERVIVKSLMSSCSWNESDRAPIEEACANQKLCNVGLVDKGERSDMLELGVVNLDRMGNEGRDLAEAWCPELGPLLAALAGPLRPGAGVWLVLGLLPMWPYSRSHNKMAACLYRNALQAAQCPGRSTSIWADVTTARRVLSAVAAWSAGGDGKISSRGLESASSTEDDFVMAVESVEDDDVEGAFSDSPTSPSDWMTPLSSPLWGSHYFTDDPVGGTSPWRWLHEPSPRFSEGGQNKQGKVRSLDSNTQLNFSKHTARHLARSFGIQQGVLARKEPLLKERKLDDAHTIEQMRLKAGDLPHNEKGVAETGQKNKLEIEDKVKRLGVEDEDCEEIDSDTSPSPIIFLDDVSYQRALVATIVPPTLPDSLSVDVCGYDPEVRDALQHTNDPLHATSPDPQHFCGSYPAQICVPKPLPRRAPVLVTQNATFVSSTSLLPCTSSIGPDRPSAFAPPEFGSDSDLAGHVQGHILKSRSKQHGANVMEDAQERAAAVIADRIARCSMWESYGALAIATVLVQRALTDAVAEIAMRKKLASIAQVLAVELISTGTAEAGIETQRRRGAMVTQLAKDLAEQAVFEGTMEAQYFASGEAVMHRATAAVRHAGRKLRQGEQGKNTEDKAIGVTDGCLSSSPFVNQNVLSGPTEGTNNYQTHLLQEARHILPSPTPSLSITPLGLPMFSSLQAKDKNVISKMADMELNEQVHITMPVTYTLPSVMPQPSPILPCSVAHPTTSLSAFSSALAIGVVSLATELAALYLDDFRPAGLHYRSRRWCSTHRRRHRYVPPFSDNEDTSSGIDTDASDDGDEPSWPGPPAGFEPRRAARPGLRAYGRTVATAVLNAAVAAASQVLPQPQRHQTRCCQKVGLIEAAELWAGAILHEALMDVDLAGISDKGGGEPWQGKATVEVDRGRRPKRTRGQPVKRETRAVQKAATFGEDLADSILQTSVSEVMERGCVGLEPSFVVESEAAEMNIVAKTDRADPLAGPAGNCGEGRELLLLPFDNLNSGITRQALLIHWLAASSFGLSGLAVPRYLVPKPDKFELAVAAVHGSGISLGSLIQALEDREESAMIGIPEGGTASMDDEEQLWARKLKGAGKLEALSALLEWLEE